MLDIPSQKYAAFPRLHLPSRKWPDRVLTKPPRWLSTDLRDGNQALIKPMDSDAKFRYYQLLLSLGYKEIEVSYPSASQTEFDFTRRLIKKRAIPDDVTIQVMAPAREDLIRTTVESVRGAKKVIVHIHVSTSPCFRDVVFNLTEQGMIDLAVRCTQLLRSLTKDSPDPEMARTEWTLEFTPENFQNTPVDYALEICEAVKAVWQPTTDNHIIYNLTSTVEMAMPNMFADQVEYFSENISERDKVCVSLHNHNDRGCAVATAELSQLAGADRVEGCLFGNGERTGNVDLVTLALNLYTQGVHPGIDFGDINHVVEMVEGLTEIPVHFRAPYAGKYVFCTFTGTHQDAIRKGYKRRESIEKTLRRTARWQTPYLPMDPIDLGRKHEAIIRLNSQSGKGGIAWYVNDVFHIDMPRELEIEFTKVVKTYSDLTDLEVTHEKINYLFRDQYMLPDPAKLELLACVLTERKVHSPKSNGDPVAHIDGKGRPNGTTNGHANGHSNGAPNGGTIEQGSVKVAEVRGETANGFPSVFLEARVAIEGVPHDICGIGNDLRTSTVDALKQLGYNIELLQLKTQNIERLDNMDRVQLHASFVNVASEGAATLWGVAIDKDPTRASVQAVLSAVKGLKRSADVAVTT